MKTIILISLLFFVSCGDNPVNSVNTPPPVENDSLIFSKDSIVVIKTYQDSIIYSYENWTPDSSLHKVKIVFDGLTNLDSTSSHYPSIIFFDRGSPFYFVWKPSLINTHISFTHNLLQPYTYGNVSFWVYVCGLSAPLNSFVKIKNLKIYKVS